MNDRYLDPKLWLEHVCAGQKMFTHKSNSFAYDDNEQKKKRLYVPSTNYAYSINVWCEWRKKYIHTYKIIPENWIIPNKWRFFFILQFVVNLFVKLSDIKSNVIWPNAYRIWEIPKNNVCRPFASIEEKQQQHKYRSDYFEHKICLWLME